MNPNSTHQLWSRWTATITPDPARPAPVFTLVRENASRFYRKAFGSATELHIMDEQGRWTIDCRTEGHPAHDPDYVRFMVGNLRHFLVNGFGPHAEVAIDVTLEAGSRQDGRPADQLILGPEPIVLDNLLLRER